MLSFEEYYKEQEIVAWGKCAEARRALGLEDPTGLEVCENEPCRQHCKFMEGRE